MALPTNVIIDSPILKLGAGNWALQWGANFDPQQLNTQKVRIIADSALGQVSIALYPSTDEKSKNATLWVTNVSGANNVIVQPNIGDTMNGGAVGLTITADGHGGLVEYLSGVNYWGVAN